MISKICSQIDEESDNKYTNFNYNKKYIKSSQIQVGIQLSEQNKNNISGIYYLNDYYKRHFVLISDFQYYETCIKKYPKDYILYKNNKYSFIDSVNIQDFKETDSISFISINDDIKTNIKNIYTKYLNPISNYKLDELQKIANDLNISLKDETGKNKIKIVLYDTINILMLNKNI